MVGPGDAGLWSLYNIVRQLGVGLGRGRGGWGDETCTAFCLVALFSGSAPSDDLGFT